MLKVAVVALGALLIALPASAQLGGLSKAKAALDKGQKAKDAIDSLIFTDAEELALGQQVSDKLRERYGVVQDKAVHKYVTLVGSVLAQASSRPALAWKFIVLDTDGVNAYASPGGFIHITRGALALLENESELAGVLGHEISHVTEKHTINSIRKNNGEKILSDLGGSSNRAQLLGAFADKLYDNVFQGVYDRGDELDADEKGAALSNKAGYAPAGLGTFLKRLDDRNKDQAERNGLFASHPDTKERIDKLAKQVTSQKLASTAIVGGRYKASITYKPLPVTSIAQVTDGASGLAGGSSKDAKPADTKSGGSKLGLGKLSALGGEKKSSSTVASAGARGGVPDRDAKGGSNPAIVTVAVTAAEVTEFKKGIVG
ncbi:MAG: M48 family metalloprotease [Acidobacteriota bacterium]